MHPASRDERFMTIVRGAQALPTEQRDTYLQQMCGGDADLIQEISELLNWEERMGGFLQQPWTTLTSFDRPFEPGQVISERFRIILEIGEGGMGVVYEVFDQKRNARIAIKVAKVGFRRLLTPELVGALKVRHPNVCLVNEIHTTTVRASAVDFLTMEFLEGETLRQRISREGAVAPEIALDIARQLCAGLSEAHRSGVLHRDLKTGNVILTTTNNGKLRAVITDFGLAGEASEDVVGAGTPIYMAPELLEGRPASQASDIYALAVILYQILTGHPPPRDASVEPPGKVVAGLDSRWDDALIPCLSPDPALRLADAARIIAVLERKATPKVVYAGVALVVVAGLLAAFVPVIRDSIVRAFRAPHVRLAVLPFAAPADSNSQFDGTLQGVTEQLRRRRSGDAPVVLITPVEAANNNVHDPLGAGRVLHATHALEGSVSRDGPLLLVEADVVDVQSQSQIAHFSEKYAPGQAPDIPKALAGFVSLSLRLQGQPPEEKLSIPASEPYLRALYLLRRDSRSFDDAIPLLQSAAQIDPHSPLPLAALSEAWLQKYRASRERSSLDQAKTAYRSAQALDPDALQVRLVGGTLNEASGRQQNALEDYSRALEIDGQNREAFQGMANVYDALDMPDKAIAAYRKAIHIEPGYYAPYQTLGVYYYHRGKYREAAEQFQNAIDRAPGLVRAYTNLAAAWSDLGKDADAEKALLASLRLKTTASALNSLGAIRTYQERHAEATEFYERALALDRRSYIVLMNLGDSYRRTARLAEAEATYRRALQLASEASEDNPSRGYIRAFVGYLEASLGDQLHARSEIKQALEFSPSDQQVIRQSVLAYEVLGDRSHTMETLQGSTLEMLMELARQPDLKSLRADPRFTQLMKDRQMASSVKSAEQRKK